MPDDVQPDAGQGGEAAGGLFDSYLQSVPEEHRETVGSYLKDASKNVDGRLREAADFRSKWEPFSQIEPLAQYDPEQLSQLLAWHQQIVANPEAYQQWLAQAAKEAGIKLGDEPSLEETDDELTLEKVQQLIQQEAEQRLTPLQQQLEQFESQQLVGTEETAIRQQFEAIEAENKIKLTEEQKQAVCQLGIAQAVDDKGQDLPMGDASWVKLGFDRLREIVSEGQKAFVNEKLQQPNLPLSAGGQEAAAAPKTFEEARQQALGRLRQQS